MVSAIAVRASSSSAVAIWNPSTSMTEPAAVPTPMVSMRTPADAASAAAACTSGPPVSSPSESTTIVAAGQ